MSSTCVRCLANGGQQYLLFVLRALDDDLFVYRGMVLQRFGKDPLWLWRRQN